MNEAGTVAQEEAGDGEVRQVRGRGRGREDNILPPRTDRSYIGRWDIFQRNRDNRCFGRL